MKDSESIDISDMPEVRELVDEAARSDEPVVLRREGKDVAVLTAISSTGPRDRGEKLTDSEIEVLRSVAGRWTNFDADAFIEQVYRDRENDYRPPVDL